MAPSTETVAGRQADLLHRREAAVPRGPFQIAPIFAARASGSHVDDLDGRRYIDFCGGIGVLNVGHNHPKVVAAVHAQLDRLMHTCWHVVMYEPYLTLAERLNVLVPTAKPAKTVFFNSGAEACENAVKIARGATGRQAVVTFERSFHGRTLLAMTMTGKVQPYKAGFGPLAPEVYKLPWRPFFGLGEGAEEPAAAAITEAASAALDDLFAYQVAADQVACVMIEPVLGEGGFYPARRAALQALQRRCRQEGILLVADEVQTGFGRCGSLLASERYDLEPDLVVMAKSLAAGLPLSAVSGPAAVMDAPAVGGIGGTYGGNPLSCAAALAALEVIEEEGLAERARVIGATTLAFLQDLEGRHGFLSSARGLGAMCAVDVVDPATGAGDPERATQLVDACRERGLLVMTASGSAIRTLMPLVISDAVLEEALGILRAAVEAA